MVHSVYDFDGVPARLIRLAKEEGTTGALRPLAAALAGLLDTLNLGDACFVPIPTTARAFRRRGYRVPEILIRQAGERPTSALRYARGVADQRGLGKLARRENMREAFNASTKRLRGRGVVLLDDVCTTGATIDEAARALAAAGANVLCAATIALTRRANDTT